MEDDEGYTVLNLWPKRGNSASPSPGGRQGSPTSARCYKIALGALGACCIIRTLVIALGAWGCCYKVCQGPCPKGNPTENNGVTQRTGSGRDQRQPGGLVSCLKERLCNPAQISSAGGSGCKLCPRDWLLHRDKCYLLSNEADTWSKSRDDCSRKGSQMLVIQDWEQMDYLKPVIKDDNGVWIGLTFNCTQRKWTWLDGAPIHEELRLPESNQVTDNGCGLLKRYRIDFDVCDTELKWLCQKAAFLL